MEQELSATNFVPSATISLNEHLHCIGGKYWCNMCLNSGECAVARGGGDDVKNPGGVHGMVAGGMQSPYKKFL